MGSKEQWLLVPFGYQTLRKRALTSLSRDTLQCCTSGQGSALQTLPLLSSKPRLCAVSGRANIVKSTYTRRSSVRNTAPVRRGVKKLAIILYIPISQDLSPSSLRVFGIELPPRAIDYLYYPARPERVHLAQCPLDGEARDDGGDEWRCVDIWWRLR